MQLGVLNRSMLTLLLQVLHMALQRGLALHVIRLLAAGWRRPSTGLPERGTCLAYAFLPPLSSMLAGSVERHGGQGCRCGG